MHTGLLIIGIFVILLIVILFYIMLLEIRRKSDALRSVQESLDEVMSGKKPDNNEPVPDMKIENVQESLSRPEQETKPVDEVPESVTWDVDHIKSKFLPEDDGLYHKINLIPDTAWSDMKDVLKKLTNLPIELTELLSVLNAPDSSSASVSKICDSSVGITAMVLRMVNSAYYCLGRHISDIKEAVTILGFDEIRQAVLTMSLFSNSNVSGANFKISRLFKHSVATANITPWLIKRAGLKIHASSTGSGAMLHGIGKLFLNRWRRGRFDNAISIASESKISLMEAELETLGITHALAGELIA
ncbi:HDOD domain-containing protein, partial [bacterium]|nr:HDOD domain-containing protein [bacterium]